MQNPEISRFIDEHESTLRKINVVKTISNDIEQKEFDNMPSYNDPEYVNFMNSPTNTSILNMPLEIDVNKPVNKPNIPYSNPKSPPRKRFKPSTNRMTP